MGVRIGLEVGCIRVVGAEPAQQRTCINANSRARSSSSIENESLHNSSRDKTRTYGGRKRRDGEYCKVGNDEWQIWTGGDRRGEVQPTRTDNIASYRDTASAY